MLTERWRGASKRSKLAAKNIVASFVLRIVSILTSLLIVPMTISYLDSAQYGIWLTISSIVSWAVFFDLGLANGFKNRFAESKAHGDIKLAREYVTITYAVIAVIAVVLFAAIAVINHFLDWASIMKVSESYTEALKKTFLILAFFLCMNMIANIFVKLLEADQRPALSSLISGIQQSARKLGKNIEKYNSFPETNTYESYKRLALIMRNNIDAYFGRDCTEAKEAWFEKNKIAEYSRVGTKILTAYRQFCS